MHDEKAKRLLLTLLLAAAALLGTLVFFRWVLPCLAPFLFAFLTAWLSEPVTELLCSRARFGRGAASALCVGVILLAVLGVGAYLASRLTAEAETFIRELPSLLSGIPAALARLEARIGRYVRESPDGVREYLDAALESLSAKATELPAELSSKALAFITRHAQNAPLGALSLAVYVIGSFFISRSYKSIRSFLARQIPQRLRPLASGVRHGLADGFSKWLRAELLLAAVVFLELLAFFLFLRFRCAALAAFFTALIDALPVLGAGLVLLPWAAVLLISGNVPRAAGLAAAFCTVTMTRSFLEPKLIGKRFGVSPAAELLAMYSGFRLAGVAGMLLFPFGLLVLKQLNDKGIVKLWK